VLSGQAAEYDLYEVAVFGLCPYRFQLERFDDSARRFQERFQLRFIVQGVWLDRIFERMVGVGTFRDEEALRKQLFAAARDESPRILELFPALGKIDREAIRGYMKRIIDKHVRWLAEPNAQGKSYLTEWGVTYERVPPAVQYMVEVGGRTVTVHSGLRHVVRTGKIPRALPNALTYLNWLLPRYRSEDSQRGSGGGTVKIDGLELLSELGDAVQWWVGAIRAALSKDAYPEDYQAYQAEIAERITAMQAGRFPKHRGTHCELCPVRHTCLGVPEL
jgi:hypothetical protein